MTAETPPLGSLGEARRPCSARRGPRGHLAYMLLTTTAHKVIGMMYIAVCFAFFLVGGLMALFMRSELALPGLQFLSNEQFNQLFTMHGTVMLLFYATPIVIGFANLVLPVQIGAPDVAFPRLNAISFWLFALGATIALAGFLAPEALPTSAGLPTHPSATPSTHRGPVQISGSAVEMTAAASVVVAAAAFRGCSWVGVSMPTPTGGTHATFPLQPNVGFRSS